MDIAYWIYGIMAALSLLFVWRYVPETKGKTLEEMEKFGQNKRIIFLLIRIC